MRSLTFVLFAGALALPAVLAAAEPGDARPVTAEQRRQAVDELARSLRQRYCIAEGAEKAAKAIATKLAAGRYEKLDDARSFAEAITADLQEAASDKHLRFGVAPPPEPAPAPGSAAPVHDENAEQAAWREQVRRGNYGLPRVEILPGNVGYLEVLRFQPPELSGDTIVAAMAFLAHADAIIVDVRNCHGGSAYVMPLFAGYFFSRPTHLFDMEYRGDAFTDHFWTAAWLPGERLAQVPMYILTSAYTFSGAEGFAYRFQVLKRATVVGETTGGGANAGGVLDIAPFFRVFMPMGRPVDGDTGTNWEGTGVNPNIHSAARNALEVAHLDAIRSLRDKVSRDADRARLDWALERAVARYHPIAVLPRDLERLAGNYGPYRVWVENEQLRIQRETETPFLLVPLSREVYASETVEPVRVEFRAGRGGAVEKLVYTDDDGRVEEFPPGR